MSQSKIKHIKNIEVGKFYYRELQHRLPILQVSL